jgi:hypothetical protein
MQPSSTQQRVEELGPEIKAADRWSSAKAQETKQLFRNVWMQRWRSTLTPERQLLPIATSISSLPCK